MTKRLIFSCILILLIFTETYSQSRRVNQMRDEFIQASFLSVNNQTTYILKWENKDTLKYHIDGKFQFISKKNWNKYIDEVSSLIEKQIIETDNSTEADIIIYFGEIVDYLNKYNISVRNEILEKNNFDHWASRKYNNKRQLTISGFCIVTSKTKSNNRGAYNVKRLFLKSLGLLGEIESIGSLFNSNASEPITELYKNDKKIIKLFYSDLIKAGMNLTEVNNALETIDLEAYYKEKI